MERYVLRYAGSGPSMAEAVKRIEALPYVRIVDGSARMLLVELYDACDSALRATLPGWTIVPELMVPLPTAPQPAIR
jgi:hypothetical protein